MAVPTIYETCDAMILAVRTDAAISSSVTVDFNKALSCFLGLDQKELPTDAQTPWFTASPGGSGFAPSQRVTQETADFAVGIRWDAKSTDSNGVTRYEGLKKIDAISQLIYRKIHGLLKDNLVAYSQIDITNAYPYFLASWSATLGRQLT